jgi:hypothetical protein
MPDGPVETANAEVWYVWTCPVCGEVQEAEPPDVEPNGEAVPCRDCGVLVEVGGT